MNNILAILLTFLGAIVMFLSILETKKIFKLVNNNKYQKYWQKLRYLMLFFLFGYAFIIILLVFKIYWLIQFLTAVIFLVGAIFVFLVVKTGFLTIEELITTHKNLVETNETLIKANKLKLKLEKAKNKAEEISKLKSNFLATISHEIRTPMNAIIGMTYFLVDTKLNEQQYDFVQTIKNSADNLLAIINDILDFSKIQSNEIELKEEDFDLRKSIEQVLSLVSPQAKKKNLELFCFIESDVPEYIKADVHRFRQVLVNLVGNAIKFTLEGEIIVSVEKRYDDQIVFSIKDTGIGIPPQHLNRLFKAFSQIDSSVNREFEGTGLGLAICKNLIRLMGGSIWVESEEGKGSTFSFTIKVKPSSLSSPELKIVSLFKAKTILLIESHPIHQKILTNQFQQWEMEVINYFSSEQNITEFLNNKSFDLIIFCDRITDVDNNFIKNEIDSFRNNQKEVSLIVIKDKLNKSDKKNEKSIYLTKPVKQSDLIQSLQKSFDIESNLTIEKEEKEIENHHIADDFPFEILIAEDNLVNQKLVKMMFKKMGYTVDIAENGLEVMNIIKDKFYDLIFMDISMPKMDGLETTRRLLEYYTDKESPKIIAMTANVMEGDREKYLKAGMNDYIPKPIKIEKIKQVIQQINS